MKSSIFLLFSFLGLILTTTPQAGSPRPTVLWHGMGDTCCFPFSMGAVKKEIEKEIPGIYVYSIMLGNSIVEDEVEGFLGHVDDQVAHICQVLKNDTNLKNGFNAIGFSQGGQFMRAYVERCNDPPVHNLITLGGQHQGVADIPNCLSVNETLCGIVEWLASLGAYEEFVQDHLVQAQYFKDPLKYNEYLQVGAFLPDINNERNTKNAQYKANMLSLNEFVLFQFTKDTVVVPRISEWFGYYPPGTVDREIPMEETDTYKQDWIGLKTLNEKGKIHRLTSPFQHMQFTLPWFNANVIKPWLNNTLA